MKITKSKLKHIIKEELKRVLLEQESFWFGDDEPEENVPTESDLNYLSSLGMDDELSTPGKKTLVSPEEVLNLRQAGVDPTGLDLGYDPDYIPGPRQYDRREQETYVSNPAIPSQQHPRMKSQFDAQRWNEREAERVAQLADMDIYTDMPGAEADYIAPDEVDVDVDLAMLEKDRPKLPETGGVFIKQKGRQHSVPHMERLLQSLSNVAGGGWYIEDILARWGHQSHKSGIDFDISMPTLINGVRGMSVKWDPRSSGIDDWYLKHVSRASHLDLNRTVEFLRAIAPQTDRVLMNRKFIPRIRRRLAKLADEGVISTEEHGRLNDIVEAAPGHENHFHVRLRGVYERTPRDKRWKGRKTSQSAPLPRRRPE